MGGMDVVVVTLLHQQSGPLRTSAGWGCGSGGGSGRDVVVVILPHQQSGPLRTSAGSGSGVYILDRISNFFPLYGLSTRIASPFCWLNFSVVKGLL